MRQSRRLRFTKANLSGLICPPGKAEEFYWDKVLPGFGLRAYASGHRQWVVQHRDATGRTRRPSFGDLRKVKLDDARVEADQHMSKVKLGADPQAAKRAARKALRVSALVDVYLADAENRLKSRSFLEVQRHLRIHAKPLHYDAAMLISRADAVNLLAKLAKASGPVAANRVRSSMSAMWAWGLQSGLIEGENPIAHVPKQGVEAPRERVLADTELTLIWQATGSDQDHDRIVRLLMLTGARREEIGSLDWAEIEGFLWTLPRARSKNGLPHEVPLGPLALAQLPARRVGRTLVFGEGVGGFSGWSRCKERLDGRILDLRKAAFRDQHGRDPDADEIALAPWTLHDLRRTVSTWLSEAGVEPHVVEAVLNHVSGAAKRGVAGVYNKAKYREPKRATLARWEAHVRALTRLPDVAGNVVPLARRG